MYALPWPWASALAGMVALPAMNSPDSWTKMVMMPTQSRPAENGIWEKAMPCSFRGGPAASRASSSVVYLDFKCGLAPDFFAIPIFDWAAASAFA